MTTRLPKFLLSAEQRALRLEPEHDLADMLELHRAPLALLGAGMDVAQPALERVAVEDRARARHRIGAVHDLLRLVDRPGRSEAEAPALLAGRAVAAMRLVPDRFDRGEHETARRHHIR